MNDLTISAETHSAASPRQYPLPREELARQLMGELVGSYGIDNHSPLTLFLNGGPETYANNAIYRWLILDAELPERGYLTPNLRRRVHYQFRVALRLLDRLKGKSPA